MARSKRAQTEGVPRIVNIGGGTGTSTLLDGLYPIAHLVRITAVLSVADSGGSSGRLVGERGDIPWGDFTRCLLALSEAARQPGVRAFWNARHSDGHREGNLQLSAWRQQLRGDSLAALHRAHRVLRVRGKVLPVAARPVNLVAQDGGEIVSGEHAIDFYPRVLRDYCVSPDLCALREVTEEIVRADLICLGPGDVHTSIYPGLLTRGVYRAIEQSRARVVFVLNLCTKPGPMADFTARQICEAVRRYLPRLDLVLVNSGPITGEATEQCNTQGERSVVDDLGDDPSVLRLALVSDELAHPVAGDPVKNRSLFRHDSHKLAMAIIALLPDVAIRRRLFEALEASVHT